MSFSILGLSAPETAREAVLHQHALAHCSSGWGLKIRIRSMRHMMGCHVPISTKPSVSNPAVEGHLTAQSRFNLSNQRCPVMLKTLAMFPSTYFYAHFVISHKKKTSDGNAMMCINSKNAHKKNVCFQLSRKNFLSDKTRLKKSCACVMRRDNLTRGGPISFTASVCCYGHSEMPEESLSSKYFCIINYRLTRLCSQNPPPKAFIVLCLLALRHKSFII